MGGQIREGAMTTRTERHNGKNKQNNKDNYLGSLRQTGVQRFGKNTRRRMAGTLSDVVVVVPSDGLELTQRMDQLRFSLLLFHRHDLNVARKLGVNKSILCRISRRLELPLK